MKNNNNDGVLDFVLSVLVTIFTFTGTLSITFWSISIFDGNPTSLMMSKAMALSSVIMMMVLLVVGFVKSHEK